MTFLSPGTGTLNRSVKRIAGIATIALSMLLGGCKSYWVEATVDNQTGQPIQQLEVDYPSASFGNNSLAPGATMNYRFQIRGNGPVKVEYTTPDGHIQHAQGLNLIERQQGRIAIRLMPKGKVAFVPDILPAS